MCCKSRHICLVVPIDRSALKSEARIFSADSGRPPKIMRHIGQLMAICSAIANNGYKIRASYRESNFFEVDKENLAF